MASAMPAPSAPSASVQAPGDLYYLPNANAGFRPYIKVPMRLGNGFKAMGDDTLITVKLIGNDANDSGCLYYLDPVTGGEKLLFSNKDSLRFGKEVVLGKAVRGAPIVFKYVNTSDGKPKYTGANEAGLYDFSEEPDLQGLSISGKPMPVSPQTNHLGDRRWAVAGRINHGQVLFGFEDLAGMASADFNDIVFILTGVQLDSEIKLPAPLVSESIRTPRTAQVSLNMPTTSTSPELRLFYTLDGTVPAFDENGPVGSSTFVYAGPFTVTGPTRVQALAWRPSVEDSTVGVTRYLASDVTAYHVGFAPPVQAAGGVYLDDDGDGRIDGARLLLAAPALGLPGSLFLEDPFRPESELELRAEDLSLDASSTVLTARFPDRPFGFGTGFADLPYGTFPAGTDYAAASVTLRDSVGPVLARVEAAPPLNGNPAWMQAVFSEDVGVDAAARAFPFAIRRGAAPDPNGKVGVSGIRKIDGRNWIYVFEPGSEYYPVPGDSLRLLDHASVSDLRGLRSKMGHYVGVTGAPGLRRGDIVAAGGSFTVGEPLVDPRALKLPVSLVQVQDAFGGPAICLDCRTGEWKVSDINRPASFPTGPRIDIRTRGPFSFDVSFFSHLGVFVNRARGTVTAGMLDGLPVDSEGNKHVALMWYPVSEAGHPVGTGVYIAQGTYQSLPAPGIGRQGEPVTLAPVRSRIGLRFGYVRK